MVVYQVNKYIGDEVMIIEEKMVSWIVGMSEDTARTLAFMAWRDGKPFCPMFRFKTVKTELVD